MLVLTRRCDEAIVIGDEIVVTILGIDGDQVKLGISAPRRIPVHRAEVYEAIQEATQSAAAAAMPDVAAVRELLAVRRRPAPE